MSDSAATAVGDARRVLVVGDAAALESTIDALASAYDPTAVIRAESVATAHDRLAETAVDCLVCAFDSERDDAVLRALAAEIDAVPIVAVADADDQQAALEAGATDVLEPAASDRVVATRISNAAAQSTDEGGERERRYRSILASAATIVWVLESDGTITDASSSVERRLGYTPDELEGTPLSQLVHPDDRDDVLATIAAVSAASLGARERQTCRLGRGDGTWTVVELTAVNRLEDPHVEGIVATVTDVTTAERADTDRRTALDRLEEPVLSLGPSSELRYVNDAGERLFVEDPEPGTVVWNALAESIREPLYERIREATATGSPVRFGTSVPDGDGRLAVTVTPGDDGVTVLARELSAEAATADEDLLAIDRDRLSLLEGVVETLADGIAILEGPTIEFANATLSEWHGGDPLVGRDLEAVFDADLAESVAERADSTLVRWMDPIQGRLTAGPEPRPVDVFVAPLPDDDRTLCVVRDRRRSASGTLSTLHRTAADIRQATTRRAVRQHAVDGIVDVTDADYVGWYRQEEGQLRPAAIATADADEGVEAPPIAYEGTPLEDVLADETGSVVERGDLGPVLSRAGIRAERVLALSTGSDGIVLAASTDPFPDHRFESVAIETTVDAATIALEGLTARDRVRDCRREQERLEGRVDQADRLQAIERDLLTADARSLVEQRLCEGVVSLEETATTAGDALELAWLGRVDGGAVEPRAWAGPAESLAAQLESRTIPVDAEGPFPASRTAATHEPASATDLEALADAATGEDTAGLDADWYRELAERGVRSVVSLPIEYDGFLYGVLTVCTTRDGGLDEQPRTRCAHLTAVAGHAISSIQRTQALLADVVTELEVGIEGDREPLSSIAARLDRRLDVRTVVSRSSGGSTVYCAIPDANAETLASISDAVEGLESIRHVGDDADGSPVELVLERTTVAETVAEHGGRVRSIVPETDRTRLVIELSSTVEVRPFIRMLERTHPGATLIARREHDRSAQPRRAFDVELRDQLSERQLRTLETAYYSGFFEWPRESTGEEVADSLGVSQPTFSRHFRTAQRKLFELLFEERLETNDETVR